MPEEPGEEGEAPPVGSGDENEAPTGPTHEPFSFPLLATVAKQQSMNGLRHNDHMRYRQYCARRLRRLYNVLQHKHGKGRYKATPFPEDFQDMRFLEIPLASAERAWSYGVQLKADNATAAVVNARWRRHSVNRFAKAVTWARMMEAVCKVHADQRTQLEAEAYCAFLEGVCNVEKEEWSEALTRLVRCKKVCEYLSLASGPEESAFLKARIQELEPLLRETKYNLGVSYDADQLDENDAKPEAASAQRDLSGLSYRGNGLAIPSDKIKDKLLKCLQVVKDVQVSSEVQDSNSIIERYSQISVEFGDVLKDIHSDMITVGADGQTSEWRMLEAFAREYSISMNVERNLVLLLNHLAKLEPLEDMSSSEARRICKPEEGMRYCEMLKEDISSLQELPETTDEVSSALTTYIAIVMNCRCFFMALCYNSLGKPLEAASLMDMLHARVDDPALGEPLQDPLGRLHALLDRLQQGLPTRVATWRCRGLAQLCARTTAKAAAKAQGGEDDAQGAADATARKSGAGSEVEPANLAVFPPRFRDVPCKPLLFDLAFPGLAAPDIESVLAAGRVGGAEGDKKGILGRVAGVAGGLGNRLGSFWGRK
mmetsp:Transcript_7341/g.18392  ORF Transcript_7341/g.18392 Transcript_7341/m.18392 type:complete len:598 (-) Transcript_7341:207-2000(-)